MGNNANYTGILTAASLGGIGNLTATGIITASSFSGDGSGLIGVASTDNIVTGTAATFNTYPVDINAGMTVAGVATFAGNVSIAGTLTYEDVTNIDSVGIITGKGADINGDIDVDGHTNLDNVSIAGVTTFASNIFLGDGDKIYLGADNDMYLWHTGSDGLLYNDTGNLFIRGGGGSLTLQSNQTKIRNDANNEDIAKFTANGGVELYYDNVKKAYTNSQGLYITNTGGDAFFRLLAPTGYHATIDMTADTHTNEDNYRIQVNTDQKFRVYGKPGGNYTSFIELDQAGKVTLTRDVDVARHLDVDGHTELDNVRISGVVTATTYYGDGSNLSNITSTTINNNADNRIITGSGTANTLEGESTITYANPNLEINTDTSPYGCLILNGNSGGLVQFEDNEVAKWSIFGDHALNFYNNANSVSRLYINSSGHMGLGVTPNANWPTNNDFKALQIGTGACVFGRGSGDEDRGGIAVSYTHLTLPTILRV